MRFLFPVVMLAIMPLNGVEEVPPVGAVFSAFVKDLPAPLPPAVPKGVTMAVTASNARAQESVRHGLTCLHTGWDVEAYRHFVTAIQEDPNCLMAHWGIGLALYHGSRDMREQREAAMLRMLDLVENGNATDLEKRYVFGLVRLEKEGAVEAASAFAAASDAYPNDPQLVLLQAMLGRGGFDVTGDPTPDQERSEKMVRDLIKRFPDESYLRYALLAMRAEAPSLKEDLQMARRLCKEAPDYPPFFHLLGHCEWREGNYMRAAEEFGRAADLYAKWMTDGSLTALHCAPWTKAECYRAVALASKGEYDSALAAAMGVASVKVPVEAANSDGGRMLLWEAKTLPARILMRRDRAGDMKQASAMLPKPETIHDMGSSTLAAWSYQAHASVIAGRQLVEEGALDEARVISENVTTIGERFVQTGDAAIRFGERSEWLRTFKGFETMAAELRGLITFAGEKGARGGAFNWFRSAADSQQRATLLMPPVVLLPMEARLGDYFADRGEHDRAIELLLEGLDEYPNDWELLRRLKAVFEASGKTEEAEDVEKRIQDVQSE